MERMELIQLGCRWKRRQPFLKKVKNTVKYLTYFKNHVICITNN